MQAARKQSGQMALALLSSGKVPMQSSCRPLPQGRTSCSPLLPITPLWIGAGFTCLLQAELPILFQHGQGTEPRWSGGGSREREPFQEKGDHPVPAICRWGPGGDRGSPEHLRCGRPHCSPRCKDCPISHPWREWSRAPAHCTVTYTQMQPWTRGHSHTLQSRRKSPAQGGQDLQPPARQQSTEDLVSQVQLPSHQQLKACILNSSAHLILAYPTVCALFSY